MQDSSYLDALDVTLVCLACILELFFLLGNALFDLLADLSDLDRRTRRLQTFPYSVYGNSGHLLLLRLKCGLSLIKRTLQLVLVDLWRQSQLMEIVRNAKIPRVS